MTKPFDLREPINIVYMKNRQDVVARDKAESLYYRDYKITREQVNLVNDSDYIIQNQQRMLLALENIQRLLEQVISKQ